MHLSQSCKTLSNVPLSKPVIHCLTIRYHCDDGCEVLENWVSLLLDKAIEYTATSGSQTFIDVRPPVGQCELVVGTGDVVVVQFKLLYIILIFSSFITLFYVTN